MNEVPVPANPELESLAAWLGDARHVTVFTGAGMSTESGAIRGVSVEKLEIVGNSRFGCNLWLPSRWSYNDPEEWLEGFMGERGPYDPPHGREPFAPGTSAHSSSMGDREVE